MSNVEPPPPPESGDPAAEEPKGKRPWSKPEFRTLHRIMRTTSGPYATGPGEQGAYRPPS